MPLDPSDAKEPRIVVQKYGGTSVATTEGRTALRERVAQARDAGDAVVVVVSAMGRAGSPYSTDTLLSLVEGLPSDDRERDMVAACGEILSAVLVAHELRDAGIPAHAMSGAEAGIFTDGAHGSATVLAVDPHPLLSVIGEGRVPVVAGFQGVSEQGATTTLGRGGSDTTACVIGAILQADLVEILTDVDGVMTADPRVCEDVRVLDEMPYDELFQMARAGAKVIHPAAAETAQRAGVPLRIGSTTRETPGTLVTLSERLADEQARVATAVTHRDDVTRVSVSLPDPADEAAHMRAQTDVYRALADSGVSLDMFTPIDGHLVFSVADGDMPRVAEALGRLGIGHRSQPGLARVTLVGAGMQGVPGVMARLSSALSDVGVSVIQSSDSHATISVLVEGARAGDAVRALHRAFALGG